MNQSNHTPGPWHTQGCTIYAGENRIAQTWDTCDDFPTPEMEADAHLIASAPELLQALESMIDAYQRHFDAMPVAWQSYDDYARSVISKAKGLR